MAKNHYQILDLPETATREEIKKRYRKLAAKHHPDKPTGNADLFAKISVAFNVLYDEKQKTAYDFDLNYERTKKTEASYNKTSNSYQNQESYYSFEDINMGFNDIKNNPTTTLLKEKPIQIILKLKINESLYGTIKNIDYERMILCSSCNGYGYGYLPESRKIQCDHCKGTGQTLKSEHIKLTIPKNTIAGKKLRIRDKGNESQGVLTGDVFVNIKWRGNWFSKNKDLYSNYELSKKELKNGYFNFKNHDGQTIKIFIPKGIKEGQTIKIEKKGWKPFDSNLFIMIVFKKNIIQKIKLFLSDIF